MKIARLLVLGFALAAVAGQYNTSATFQQNYKQWGWDTSYVLTNNIITTAVVPKVGGRILQYDLGTHPVLWINPAEAGKSYWGTGAYGSFGGYKMWPAPQGNWDAMWGNWPPPNALDQGPYSAMVTATAADSSTVYVQSLVESDTTACKGLQFKRYMTIYKGSSRMRVEQIMEYHDPGTVGWSVWDVTQVAGQHGTDGDWNNFWVYFPKKTGIEPDSSGYFIMWSDTVKGGASQAKPNIAPGISGMQYNHIQVKMGSTSDGGWIASADQRDGIVYVKRFQYFTGAEYPDEGSVIQVYAIPDSGVGAIEVEALSPMQPLNQNGSYSFVIDWYAASMHGPVLTTNKAGAVSQHLAISNTGVMTGRFGVFYAGRVDLKFDNSATVAKTYTVTPLDSFNINETITVPSGATKAFLCLYNQSSVLIDTLDKVSSIGNGVIQHLIRNAGWSVDAAGSMIKLSSKDKLAYHITVMSLNGAVVGRFAGMVDNKQEIRFDMLAPGTYLVNVSVESHEAVVKLSVSKR